MVRRGLVYPNKRWKLYSFGDGASDASHDIDARYVIEASFCPSRGDIASAACHDVGLRYAILNHILCQYCD